METAKTHRPAHAGCPSPLRVCHFCKGPIPRDEKAIRARTENAWAHFECWYERDPETGELLDVR